jgi:type I restriction enzyme S subunit
MSDWAECALGDLFRVKHGFAFKSEYFTDRPQPTVLVTPGNFSIGGGFKINKSKFYDGPIPNEYILRSGQVVVTMTDLSKESDTLGFAAVVPDDGTVWLHNQRVGLLEFDRNTPTDKRFVHYLLRTHGYRAWIVGSASGTTVKHTSPSRIESYRCPIPPLVEQQAIGHILGSIDDKIELNRRANQSLEAMARAMFRDWFVDFGPVRAKLRGDRPYIERALWDRFPDGFASDGQPLGWRPGRLGDIAAAVADLAAPSAVNPGTPYIGLEHMPRQSIALESFGLSEDVSSQKSRFARGDVLFGKLRPYFHKVGVAPISGICSTDIIVMRPVQPHWRSFLALCASSDELVAHADRGSTGTKMPRTSWSAISKYAISVPDAILAQAFEEIVGPMIDSIVAGVHESATLASLRSALLPKLMSGEIRIRNTEQFMEELSA